MSTAAKIAGTSEFSLEKIAHGLYRLFGEEAAEIMLERIFLKLDDLAVIVKK